MKEDSLHLLMQQILQLQPLASVSDNEIGDGIQVNISNGIANIPVSGTLVKSGAADLRYWGMDATGYDEIGAALNAAQADKSVHAIVLSISSPGGQVDGCQALADAVLASGKPVVAQVSDMCASAAYWIASQCNSITANRTAMVGSIGVYTVARDYSRMMENAGIKTHLISSGGVKGMGAPGTQVTDEQLAETQKMIDGVCSHFIDSIALGRGVDAPQIRALADGRIYLAASAQSIGLIDAVSNSAEVYRMNIEPNALVSLVERHPARALDINKLAAANKSETEILASIEAAQHVELASKSAAMAEAFEQHKAQAATDLAAKDAVHAAALAAKDLELAELKGKHDALAKLADNGVRDPGEQHGDPAADAQLPIFTSADASAGKIPAELLKSGKYQIAEPQS